MPSGLPESLNAASLGNTIFSAIRNSSAFYFSDAEGNWTTPLNGNVWQDRLKTLFDPCPSGWRVPRSLISNPWVHFTDETGSYTNGDWNAADPGGTWFYPVVFGGDTWYPANGLRTSYDGKPADLGARGLYWTASGGAYYNIAPSGCTMNGATLAFGFPVRCVRE